MATLAQLLASAQALEAVSDSPRLDVELLLCHCLGVSRSYLRTWPEREIDPAQAQAFEQLLVRRIGGEPVAYLTGSRGFWTLDLQVSTATLIPRPETELLVEQALSLVGTQAQGSGLDLGSGSGAIALALAHELPGWHWLGCDRVPEAVALAQRNAEALGIGNVQFQLSDWFASLPAQRYDLIVSNPPYIDADDPHLRRGDVRFEPASALVAAQQGMADLRAIISAAPAFLLPGGYLLLEHGYQQGAAVRAWLAQCGFSQIQTCCDLAGHERVSRGRYQAD